MYIILSVGLILVITAFLVWGIKLIWFRPFNINHLFERIIIQFALDNPEMLSHLRFLERYGIKFHQDDLKDISIKQYTKFFRRLKRDLAQLRSYDRSKLTSQQRLSKDAFEYFLDLHSKGEPFFFHDYLFNPAFGIQTTFPQLMQTSHVIETSRDARDYVARLSKIAIKFDQAVQCTAVQEERGIIPPVFVLQHTIDQMREFITPARQNILYTALARKMAQCEDIVLPQRMEFLKQAKYQIEQSVYPAYRRVMDYFEELKKKSANHDGVWSLPQGDEFYIHQLQYHTTTELDAEQIHNIGISEVQRIQQEIFRILGDLGINTNQSFIDAFDELLRRDNIYYMAVSNKDIRQTIIDDYGKIINDITHGLDDYFHDTSQFPIEVKAVPRFKEKTSPEAYYHNAAVDGSRAGVFYINLQNAGKYRKLGMRTLAYHECIPGHHLQITTQLHLKGVPMFRKILPITAYTEGWAMYAEQLAWEAGFHEDPTDNLGRLQSELTRAARLVVDTGIHYKRWTRKESIKYLVENAAMDAKKAIIEVERYIVVPGQATAYKIGMMKILEIREKTKKRLGKRFSLPEFHQTILNVGAIPLSILEKHVEATLT